MLRAEPDATTAAVTRVRGGWAEMALATGALLVLLLGFRTVVEGADWFVSTALVALLVATATITLRLVGLNRVVTPVALVAELVVLSWVFVPSTLLVVVPTPDTVVGLGDLVQRAGPIISEEQAPVAPSPAIVLVLAAAFGALVVVLDMVLRREHGLTVAGVLLLAVFVTPGLITGTAPSVWLFVPAAVLWLVLLRGRTAVSSAAGTVRHGPAVALGMGGLVAALLFPTISPDIGSVAASWGKPPPQVFGRGINPMVELGTNLRRNSPVTVMSYTTTLDDAPYLKVATLPDFTGETWKPAENFNDGRFEGRLAISDDVDAERRSTRIAITQLRSELLPVPYPAVDIRGLDGGYRVERTGLTVSADSGDVRNQTYVVQSLDVQPTAQQLRASPSRVTPDLRRYVELEAAPPIIARTAREVTRDASTNYDRALALQSWFRSGEFEYSETAPVAEDYDGNGLDVIAEFLQRKAGYCVHFSSAMAVMARSLDIPARIAVGYAPGDPQGLENGRRLYTVQSSDLHAWTELYFAGIGWVKFDPTPGVGESTAFVEPSTTNTGDTPAEQAPEDAPEESNQGTRAEDEAVDSIDPAEQTSTAPRSVAAVLVVLVGIVVAPIVVRRLRREWRLSRSAHTPDPAWREVQDTARDLGLVVSESGTPRAFAQQLAGRPGVDQDAVSRLLDVVERSRYAASSVPSGRAAEDARAVISTLVAGAPRRTRLRALLLPRSLAPRPQARDAVYQVT
jgi:transglutaminase-like putative cysteine protease